MSMRRAKLVSLSIASATRRMILGAAWQAAPDRADAVALPMLSRVLDRPAGMSQIMTQARESPNWATSQIRRHWLLLRALQRRGAASCRQNGPHATIEQNCKSQSLLSTSLQSTQATPKSLQVMAIAKLVFVIE